MAEATTEPVSVKDARSRVRDNVTIGVVDSSVRLVQAQNANGYWGPVLALWIPAA